MGPRLQTLATTLTTSLFLGIVNLGFCEVQPYHWQAVFKSYETTKLYRDPRRSFCCFPSQIWEPSDIICLGVWLLAEDLKLRGAIIRDKELIMLPNEQATRWEDGEGGRSEWLWRLVAVDSASTTKETYVRDQAPKCVGHRGSTKMWKRTDKNKSICAGLYNP